MSQKSNPVPRLNLAPKLSRPLSLWNPLDYLRLLYWVFFFPQALRSYIDTFGGNGFDEAKTWQERWECLQKNPIEQQLVFQNFVSIFVISIVFVSIIQNLFIQQIIVGLDLLNILISMFFGIVLGGAIGLNISSKRGISTGVGVAGVVCLVITISSLLNLTMGLITIFSWGLGVSIGLGVISGIPLGMMSSVTVTIVFNLMVLVFRIVQLMLFSSKEDVLGMSEIFSIIVVSFLIARPENWLLALPSTLLKLNNQTRGFPNITPIPIPYLSYKVANWLRKDWNTGLHNVNELLRFTLQFIPVIKALNLVLSETPREQVIYRVSQLAEDPYDWDLVRFTSASLSQSIKLQALRGFLFMGLLVPERWQQGFNARFTTQIRLDTPARAVAAGFWYLYKKEPEKARKAFAVVRDLPYGEELFILAEILATFNQAKNLADIATIEVISSVETPLLRPITWEAITSLNHVISEIKSLQNSVAFAARSLALNRALAETNNVLNKTQKLPQAEREIIVNIAEIWKKCLLEITGEIGNISITEPVINPYVIGDPVQGKLFVGREDIMRELKEFWVVSHRLQSVVLYGHRRMGKTSILLNVGNILGAKVHLAYINLLLVGQSNQGVGEVLIKISDAISLAVNLPSPADEDFLKLPYITFERYLKQVVANLDGGLIIALDEFEKIEELIEAKKIDPDFMGFLRGLVQMSPKIAFALAGLHTLEEMTEDYFHPFFSSIIPIRVGFLSPGATRQILANPDDDFLLDYKPEAMDTIYQLTHGQPYLVQLIGFLLVRRYNDLVFEMGKTLDPVFTREDVEAVINDPDFFIKGRYYFTGVWGQSAQGARGQQEILKVLAPHPEGINLEGIIQGTNMDEKTLNEAIETLKRHDVIQETNHKYHIIVELFRRWVLQNK
ncbi:ATP-binding protein [Kamptonema sp. UHCC 0994]|uniref:ATP-binding protein n=1 Tax=Kamptonema sp. UHCC 0994 TaxID=3031329 RepID=UPI0023B966E4|nr:ATP-binding protein [Kamptonema sp. UHCC 0994]MDF0552239.1 ATP-binding protein [Kamptonema sp. UHCC 0994]